MEKTIRMPKRLLAKWLAALRSGEYRQHSGCLCNHSQTAFCCLGVLVAVGGGDPIEEDFGGFISSSWRDAHEVAFFDRDGERGSQPFLPRLGKHATQANDTGTPFAELADAIEACAEGI